MNPIGSTPAISWVPPTHIPTHLPTTQQPPTTDDPATFSCLTESSMDSGVSVGTAGLLCLFPFTDMYYPGVEFTGCTTAGTQPGEPAWCSVNGGVGDKDWGYCPDTCRRDTQTVGRKGTLLQ